MNPSRPRPSVLELFDPLSRDTHSPESDKENILPDSGFDYDFLPPVAVKHPSPVRLTRRLVEVGDVTVDSSVLERGDAGERSGLQEDDDDDDDDTTDTVTVVLPPTPRTPLGDVTFDRERTPMRSKMYRRNLPGASVAAAAGSKPASSASDGCPVLINAVNTTVGPSLDATAATPSVVISCPDESPSSDSDALSTSLATLALATPTGSLIGDTTLAFPTPSPSEASTSLVVPRPQAPPPMAQLDPDTSSAEADADLHASFALHMSLDAAETSFDLLNDKISFLAHNEESYYFDGGLESILDLEQENANESDANSLPTRLDPAVGVAEHPSRVVSPPVVVLPEALSTVEQHTAPPAEPVETSIIPPPAPVFVPSPPRQISPIPVLSTSLAEPASLISALKIVKRKRPDAVGGSESAPLPVRPLCADGSASVCPPVPRATRIASSKAQSVVRPVVEGQGPWRVPVFSSDKEGRATSMTRVPKTTPATTLAGPRRVPLPTAVPVPTPAPVLPLVKAASQVTQTIGLKRPLRLVPPNGSTSGLPRAVAVGGTSNATESRLPVPKTKIATRTGLPRRRIP